MACIGNRRWIAHHPLTPTILAPAFAAGREIDHYTLQVLRQQAVKAVKNGQTAASVAATMGVNIRSVIRWLSDFATGGQNALLA